MNLIVNALTLEVRYPKSNGSKAMEKRMMAPNVLTACLQFAGPQILVQVESVMNDLLDWLTRWREVECTRQAYWIFSTLQAFEAFVSVCAMKADMLSSPPDTASVQTDAVMDALVEEKRQAKEDGISLHLPQRVEQCSEPMKRFILKHLRTVAYRKRKARPYPIASSTRNMEPASDTVSNDETNEFENAVQKDEKSLSVQQRQHLNQLTTDIVHIVRHFLGSEYAMIRCQVLRILRHATAILHTPKSDLLALIHELWEDLLCRLMDKQNYVRIETIQFLRDCVGRTGDFMSRRVRDHIAPICLSILCTNEPEQQHQMARDRLWAVVKERDGMDEGYGSMDVKLRRACLAFFESAVYHRCVTETDASSLLRPLLNRLYELYTSLNLGEKEEVRRCLRAAMEMCPAVTWATAMDAGFDMACLEDDLGGAAIGR
jgi:hypothetical protein